MEYLRTAKFILLSAVLKDDSLMTWITINYNIKKSHRWRRVPHSSQGSEIDAPELKFLSNVLPKSNILDTELSFVHSTFLKRHDGKLLVIVVKNC
jgi:hypothetical protein